AAAAVGGAERQVVGQVAGVLADEVLAVLLDRGRDDVQELANGATVEVIRERRAGGVVLLRHVGQFEEVVVGDVPVDRREGLRILDLGLVEDRAATHRGGVAFALVGLGGGEEEQLVLDDRTAGVGAVGDVAGLARVAARVQLARQRRVGVGEAVRQ